MNLAIENLNSWAAQAARFAWPMLWQSSLLILVLLLLDFVLRRKLRAAVRYALWLVVLVKLVLPPSLALPTSLAWWVRPPLPDTPTLQSAHATIAHPTEIIPYRESLAVAEIPVLASTLAVAVPPPVPKGPRLTPAAWLIGACSASSLVLLAWMLLCWRQVAREAGRALPAPDWLHELLRQAGQQAGLRHPIGLGLTRQSSSPAVCGLFRPRVLLPRALADQMTQPQLRAVLLHELIHSRRRDLWVNCAQALLQIVYWWHPLLWLANARIRRAREEAVDDAVMLALNADAHVYAPTLLEVAKLAFRRPLASLGLVGILESKHALRHRIERLVNLPTPQRAGLTLLSLLGIMAFTAVALPQGQAPTKSTAKPSGSSSSASHSPTNTPSLEVSSLSGAAGSVHYDLTTGLTHGSNGVRVKYGATVLTADSVIVNEGTGELIADGNVRLQLDQQSLAAEHLRFNFKAGTVEALTKGAPSSSTGGPSERKPDNANQGATRAAPNINLSGPPADELEKLLGQQLILHDFKSAGYNLPESIIDEEVQNRIRSRFGDETTLTKTLQAEGITREKFRQRIRDQLIVEALKQKNISSEIIVSPHKVETHYLPASKGRGTILSKLNSIRLDHISFDGLPLGEVVRALGDEIKKRDPEKRGINLILNPVLPSDAPHTATFSPDGRQIVTTDNTGAARVWDLSAQSAPAEPADISQVSIRIRPALTDVTPIDVLDAIVIVAASPIQYYIEDYAVVISWRGQHTTPFHVRTFIVDPTTFIQGLHRAMDGVTQDTSSPRPAVGPGLGTNLNGTNALAADTALLRQYFLTLGVDFTAPGRSFFWSDRQGRLMVRASMDEIDIIEQAIRRLNVPPETPTIPSAPGNTHTNAGATDRTTKLNGPLTAAAPKNQSAAPASSSASLRPSMPSESARESQKQGSPAPNGDPSTGRLVGSASPLAALSSQRTRTAETISLMNKMADVIPNFSFSAKLNIDLTIISLPEPEAQAFWAEFPRTNSPGDATRSVVLDPLAADVQLIRWRSNPKASILYYTTFATTSGKQTRLGLDSTFPDDISIIPVVTLDASMVRMTIVPSLLELPHFRIRKVTSSAAVGDGQTLIFGTSRILRTKDAQELKENVPLLGDLPIPSGLFNQGTELLILLTPQIDSAARP